ncbi:hypothetical protein N0V84_007346 [Fusarium piperis]|uniref:Uncharacterized protein n=1 Tax=Fusarium piperis TaxID=1435070 RepID=A0A9W8WA98_9HYPO|nr:hypothetical protein N0V84_007346 [Fusarium piperis]
MVNVYRHSLCNISAISASSDPGRSRLFVKRRLQSRLLFPFKFNGKLRGSSGGAINDGPWIFWNGSLWADEIESTPLSTRGWVVQERFLTPRVLHFTENQIYWECLENECCEADPTGKFLILAHASGSPKIVPTVYKKARLELAKKRTDLAEGRSTDDTNVQFHTQWGDVVSLYANCALTKESDRLIAMSGIAKTFQEANNDKYLAGLWKKVIYTNLTWTTNASDGAKVHRSKSYAPTWSWASVTGGHKRLSMLHQRYSRLPNPLIKLVEERIVTEPPGGDPTGLLRSAELDIECLLYYYRWTADSSKLTVYTDEARTQCYFEKEKKPKDLHLDTTGLVQKFAEADEMEGVCVPLCGAYGGYGGGTNVYLMLEHDSGTRFKRIGVFEEGEIGHSQ